MAAQIFPHMTGSLSDGEFPQREGPKVRGQLGGLRQKLKEKQACFHPKRHAAQKGAYEMIREGKGINIYQILSLCQALC